MKKRTFELRGGLPTDAETISELAMRSKAHWGYDEAFMSACRPSLTYSSDEIGCGEIEVVVAESGRGRSPLGFAALGRVAGAVHEAGEPELDALFVDPLQMGRGVGSELLGELLRRLRKRGEHRLWILADPHAEAFYRSQGAVTVEERPSDAIEGRSLPWMRLDFR